MAITCRPLRLASFRKLCAIAVFALCAQAALGQSASYRVHIGFDHPLRATVNAQLEAHDGVVFTAQHAGGYAWWDFIRNPRELLEMAAYSLSKRQVMAAGRYPTQLLARCG
jgi:hypothetical protein